MSLVAPRPAQAGSPGDQPPSFVAGSPGRGWRGLLILPGAATVYLSFQGGAFYAGTPALAAVVLLGILALRATLADRPLEGVTAPIVLAASSLALLAVWTLVSSSWSHAPARALIEFDRTLLYLATLVVFGSIPWRRQQVAWLVRWLALGMVSVCAIALITQTLPDVWPVESVLPRGRLGYPITYPNALGLLAAVALLLCLYLATSRHEPAAGRCLGAAAAPLVATTLLFTFSRGAIAAAAVSLLAFVLLSRSRGLGPGLLATAPPTAAALIVAYRTDLLGIGEPGAEHVLAQGHAVALTVAACVGAAGLARLLLVPLDRRLERWQPNRHRVRTVQAAVAALALIGGVILAVSYDAPGVVGDQYQRFLTRSNVVPSRDIRSRLTDPGNNGRLREWQVALQSFREDRVHGTGAGTYRLRWARYRPGPATRNDGHSLYLETLGEMGVVGLGLIVVTLGALLLGLLRRTRDTDRPLYAVLFAAALAWSFHAGFDWDWELPAVTLWLFAAAGAALAVPRGGSRTMLYRPGRLARIVAGLAAVILAVVPARMAVSQVQLNRSVTALERGDCKVAIDLALSSNRAQRARPEPFEVIGLCNARLGRLQLSMNALAAAERRDPDNWEYPYELALVRATAGIDPRSAARRALELNPRGRLTTAAAARLAGHVPSKWRREALRLPIPGHAQ